MHFTAGPAEQKGKNLSGDDRVLLQMGRLDWQGGLDVAVEDPVAVFPLQHRAERQQREGEADRAPRADAGVDQQDGGTAVDRCRGTSSSSDRPEKEVT